MTTQLQQAKEALIKGYKDGIYTSKQFAEALDALAALATVSSDASPSPVSVQPSDGEILALAAKHIAVECVGSEKYSERVLGFAHALLSQPASICKTCDGHGLVGGLMCFGPGEVDSIAEPCPDCNQPAQPISSDAQPVAFANWKVGTKSYVPFRTREEAEASVLRSEVSATQNGPYAVAELYASPAPYVRPSVPVSDEQIKKLPVVAYLQESNIEMMTQYSTPLVRLEDVKAILSQPVSAQGVSNEEMLRREIHNLKRHIEDYCQPAQTAPSMPVGEVIDDHPVHGWHMRALVAWEQIGAGAKLYAAPVQAAPVVPDVDWLSNVIRMVDGEHKLGAGALAEKIVEAIAAAPSAPSNKGSA